MGYPVVAAFDRGRPVAFAYVASETETQWDVTIDTIESHRHCVGMGLIGLGLVLVDGRPLRALRGR